MESNHFQILLVLLVVAYKGWEFLRNAARKKSDAARNVPVPTDLEEMPWEEPEPPPRQEQERPVPRTFSPRDIPAEVAPVLAALTARPRPVDIVPIAFQHSTRTAPIVSAGNKAMATPALRDLILGQVILGKPVSLSRGGAQSPVRR
ncbi:MAG: hypothetical protein IPN71_10210 [Fibrobacteres bacterium]|nr:hypothetical protein [Fibrobacterota bacterium]